MSKRFIYLLSLLLVTALVCPAQTIRKQDCPKDKKATAAVRTTSAKKRKAVVTAATPAPKKDTLVLSRVQQVPVSRRKPELTDSALLMWVNFLTPAPEKKKTRSVQGSIPLDYSKGQKAKYDERNYYEAMYKLQSVLHQLKADPNVTIKEIRITGFTAPDGNYRLNEKMSMQRALGLTDYIRNSGSLETIPFEVNWVSEDWNKMTQLIEQSEMPFKASVLDIIRTVDVVNGREAMLMNLAGGSPYQYLSSYIFPQLRRMEYVIEYGLKNGVLSDSQKISYADLSLSDFYNLAQGHERGSDEFKDLIDLAGRLFPDSPVACINAAAVALSRHNIARARGYLMRYATLAEAGNNMGILYLLEGNLDKAEVYLELAQAAGVKQAGEALNYIKKIR